MPWVGPRGGGSAALQVKARHRAGRERFDMSTLITRSAVLAVVVFAGAAYADTPWAGGMANGSATFFDWANGHNSDSNLFGTPTLVGDTFYFFPSNFVASSNNGVPASATDTIDV